MSETGFVDIHCHLLPGLDDGARDLRESLSMAQMAVADGITTIICTPHQLGNYVENHGQQILHAVHQLQQLLQKNSIPLEVLPGADVRIESDIVSRLRSGDVLTLGNHRRHVLLELPHELYLPLEPVIHELQMSGIASILSHPERNQGILGNPGVLVPLVQTGCLMQITAGSLVGTFGPQIQKFAKWMLQQNLVHFVATDAHGVKARRPLIRRAFDLVTEVCGNQVARTLCHDNPACIAAGMDIETPKSDGGLRSWFGRRRAG